MAIIKHTEKHKNFSPYMCTIINVNYESLSTVRYFNCISQKVAGLSLSSNFTRTVWSVMKKKCFLTYQYNYLWSLLRYLFCCLSWLSSTHLHGISGYCIKSADLSHICHLQAVLRCWESSSHRHTGVPAHGKNIRQTATTQIVYLF